MALAEHPSHVQEAIRYAAGRGLPVAVLATGHRASVSFEGGVLVSTAAMRGIHVDVGHPPLVGPGATWGEVAAATHRHGLAPLAGSAPSVGAVGYTLGGGISPALGRRHGFAADHVTRLDIVTSDGELRTATPDRETDLFWAARGGKGSFGVVTSIELTLFPQASLYAGAISYPAEAAPEVLAAWRDWAAAAPESVTTSAAFVQIPPNALVPEPIRGRHIVSVRVSFSGPVPEGAALVAPLRAVAPVLLDTVAEIPFTDWARIHTDPPGPLAGYERTALLRELSDDALTRLIDLGGAGSGSPMVIVETRQLGGAFARQPAVANAVGHRDAAFTLLAIGVAEPGQAEEVRAHGAHVIAAMQPWSTGGAHANFLSSDETRPEDVERAYPPETYRRLRSPADRRRDDPT